jgi:hypothetical protein
MAAEIYQMRGKGAGPILAPTFRRSCTVTLHGHTASRHEGHQGTKATKKNTNKTTILFFVFS